MFLEFKDYYIDAIHEKYAWRLCDFCTINAERLRRFFPKTLEQNLTPDLSKYFVERKIKAFQNKEEFLFVLKEKENHTLIGLIYLKELDWEKKQGELAYALGYQVEGKGYMTETVKAIFKWAFEDLQLETLQIITHKTNTASVRVAEKCEFIWQKVLLGEHTPPGESPLDMELYELHNSQ
ncbi:GNAT family N-acetyltransferase [Maribacter sp. 2308TA10-17]|uniref:GNAT family N-acetyltransferase n=1 Tax=Maribacter sp. 2308TA10-17 TaxID=3386276 RepID=UPI0039BCAE66